MHREEFYDTIKHVKSTAVVQDVHGKLSGFEKQRIRKATEMNKG